MPYKAVIFDMGGVLIQNPESLIAQCGELPNMEASDITKAMFHPDFVSNFKAAEKGEIGLKELEGKFLVFCQKLFNKPELTNLPMHDKMKEMLHLEHIHHQKMIETVQKIRENGIKTAVLTNNMFFDSNKDESAIFIDKTLFDKIIESCRVGMRKPEKSIYEMMLQKLNCKPEEVIFLDDFPWNLKPAKEMGMTTIWVKTEEQAVSELKSILCMT